MLFINFTVGYKGKHKSSIQTIFYQFDCHSITQLANLANYHGPKFVAGISKKAKRKQSAALLLMENA